jgi:hypothetical protein
MSHRHAVAGIIAVSGAALLAGCASANSGAGTPTEAHAASARPVNGTSGTFIVAAAASAPALTVGMPSNQDLQRSVRAAYTVPKGTFLASFDGVVARAVGLGGYVSSSLTTPDAAGRIVAGSVTLAIPASDLAMFLNGMPSTFTASSIDFSSIDHTAQFVDVDAELASEHAQLHALDALLSNATSLSDITTLEQQVETVQVQIDTDQGQLNVLSASVEMATATIVLSERGAPALEAVASGPVASGLTGGWHNAIRLTGAVLDALVTAIPVLVIAMIGLALWRWMPRRVRRATRPAP